jgi:DNA topoisomerase-1
MRNHDESVDVSRICKLLGEGQPRDVITFSVDKKSLNGEVRREIVQEKTGSTKGKLIPTPSGEVLSDFLNEHFNQVVDYGWTADLEQDFDKIAIGDENRNEVLDEFYKPFHELIVESGGIDRSKVAQSREIGVDPKSGKVILARFGRFGPMLQLGDTKDESDKPKFAPLPTGTKIETVTLEQSLKMFQLPRLVGKTEKGEDIKANIGRFGPYIQVNKTYVSIKPISPFEITESEARMLYDEKLKADAAKNIADFGDGIKVLNGRFGPYVTDGTKNIKIPKTTDPKTITHEEAKVMIEKAPAKAKKTPAKKTKTATAKKSSVKKPRAKKSAK